MGEVPTRQTSREDEELRQDVEYSDDSVRESEPMSRLQLDPCCKPHPNPTPQIKNKVDIGLRANKKKNEPIVQELWC